MIRDIIISEYVNAAINAVLRFTNSVTEAIDAVSEEFKDLTREQVQSIYETYNS